MLKIILRAVFIFIFINRAKSFFMLDLTNSNSQPIIGMYFEFQSIHRSSKQQHLYCTVHNISIWCKWFKSSQHEQEETFRVHCDKLIRRSNDWITNSISVYKFSLYFVFFEWAFWMRLRLWCILAGNFCDWLI